MTLAGIEVKTTGGKARPRQQAAAAKVSSGPPPPAVVAVGVCQRASRTWMGLPAHALRGDASETAARWHRSALVHLRAFVPARRLKARRTSSSIAAWLRAVICVIGSHPRDRALRSRRLNVMEELRALCVFR